MKPPGLNLLDLQAQIVYPQGILSGKVHCYLQIQVNKPTQYRIMPDGTQAVFVSPDRSFIAGIHSTAYEIDLRVPGTYFGIWFLPGALRCFSKMNLAEIAGLFIDHRYFPLAGFSNLSEQIYRQNAFNERVSVCENWLLANYTPMSLRALDAALHCIYRACGNLDVQTLSERVGCSCRQLNRHFLFHVGINPKTFIQIVRIQHVYQQRYLNPKALLPCIHDAGFYDQSHFLKTAKKLLPETHRAFFDRIRSDFYNH